MSNDQEPTGGEIPNPSELRGALDFLLHLQPAANLLEPEIRHVFGPSFSEDQVALLPISRHLYSSDLQYFAEQTNTTLEQAWQNAIDWRLAIDSDREAWLRKRKNDPASEDEAAWALIYERVSRVARQRLFHEQYPGLNYREINRLVAEVNQIGGLLRYAILRFSGKSTKVDTKYNIDFNDMVFSIGMSEPAGVYALQVSLEYHNRYILPSADYRWVDKQGYYVSPRSSELTDSREIVLNSSIREMLDSIREVVDSETQLTEIERVAKRVYAARLSSRLDGGEIPFSSADRAIIDTMHEAFREGSDTEIFLEFWRVSNEDRLAVIMRHWQRMNLDEILVRMAHGAHLEYEAGNRSTSLGGISIHVVEQVLQNQADLVKKWGDRVVDVNGEPDEAEARRQIDAMISLAVRIAKSGIVEGIKSWGDADSFVAGLLIGRDVRALERLYSVLDKKGLIDQQGRLRLNNSPEDTSPFSQRKNPKLLN